MTKLRVIGDVHGQFDFDDLVAGRSVPYQSLIAHASHSIQVGDMGDAETYGHLDTKVDKSCHRFFPGNHDHYNHLGPHSLGDFGASSLGGVDFFFIRGAESIDRAILERVGLQVGKKLWFEEEQLTPLQMQAARDAYLQAKPDIVFTHDAPTDIARGAWHEARKFSAPNPRYVFHSSRTSDFLTELLELHQPRLWAFGHYHRDWQYQESKTLFVCVGELCYIDIDEKGFVLGSGP